MPKINIPGYKFLLPAILFLSLLIAACEVFLPTSEPDPPAARPPAANPFNLRMEGEDGTMVEIAGPSANLDPGGETGYQLSIFNGSDQLWEDSYCLVLLDSEGFVALLDEDDFSLPPRDGVNTHLSITLPQDLQPGPYALSFIIPDRWASVNTIYIGDTQNNTAGPWPPQVGCP